MSSFETAITAIMAQGGFAGATRVKLMEDASTRSYERLILGDKTAILMKAPPGNENPPCPVNANEDERLALGWNAVSRLASSRVEAFIAIADFLRANGFSTPQIFASDIPNGLAVIEDLGNNLYANILAEPTVVTQENSLYAVAGELLAKLHQTEIPKSLNAPIGTWPILDFDSLALHANADLFIEWVPKLLGRDEYSQEILNDWNIILKDLIQKVLCHPRVFTLRDYHAENILWLDERKDISQIGLLDFQDAVIGFRAWDFSMLLHDARRDVSPSAHEAAISAYVKAMNCNENELRREIDLEGAVNCLRIIGIFARLIERDKKLRYREFMPRMIAHLTAVLENPLLATLKKWIEAHAPLEELANVCAVKSSRPRAIVFAAGLGTRMRPLTNDKPKALVEVAGRTLIDHMLDNLAASGVGKVVINTFHFADKLVAHLKSREGRLPIITYSREDKLPEPLETEGGLINALPLMGQGVILTCNADAIWLDETAISRALAAYDPDKMDGLLLLANMSEVMGFDGAGDFFMDEFGHLTRRGDAPSAPYAYAGVQITHTELFDKKTAEKRSLAKTWFEEWAPNKRLYGIVLEGPWLHVGDPISRDEAEAFLLAQ